MKQMMMGILSMLLLMVAVCVTAQTTEDWAQKEREWKEKAKDVYVFPVRPGMPEWAKFKTHAEMIAACQIPENILNTMSTAGLVETCLNYPLFGDITAYGDLQKGIERIMEHFRGLQELIRRQDAGAMLLERYQTMDPEIIYTRWKSGLEEEFSLKFLYIEILLAQDNILSAMSPSIQLAALQESLRVFRAKQELAEYYGRGSLATSLLIMAKIMQEDNYLPLQQQITEIPQEDPVTLKQRILLKRPDLKNTDFAPVPLSGIEKYHQFLETGGWLLSEELLPIIVRSSEQYLSGTQPKMEK